MDLKAVLIRIYVEGTYLCEKRKMRVRFAPSPTGPLHIGGVRTALFNYLYARKNKGVFILRIEDTDQNRYIEGSEDYIQNTLEWTGMVPDEGPSNGGNYGPYRQSERKELYQKYIEQLLANGAAYYSFDTPEELENARKESEKKGETFRYGAHNRMNFDNSLNCGQDALKEKLKGSYVVRLKINPEYNITVKDEVRGFIRQEGALLDDKILMKADGMPTYHFANVVDDHLMRIDTVIRGEEWLPSLPIHQLLYEAFQWKAPKFMHLPLILKPSGKGKLSKRDGDKAGFPVFPLDWNNEIKGFKQEGFIAEAFVNYLALLGWNSGKEQELFSLKELEALFSVGGIQKGGARFDIEKARWINHQYINKKTAAELLEIEGVGSQLSTINEQKQMLVLELIKERLFTLNEIAKECGWLRNPNHYDEKIVKKLNAKGAGPVLKQLLLEIEKISNLDDLNKHLKSWAKENQIPLGLMMQSLRISLVGSLSGPDLFEICKLLGKAVILERIDTAISFFNLNT